MVLLSTHNICFSWDIRIFFDYALLSGGLAAGFYLSSLLAAIKTVKFYDNLWHLIRVYTFGQSDTPIYGIKTDDRIH